MTFLNPILALVGLACVAIPVVIHILMRRRRQPVAWGAMKFLMEAYRQQRRRTRLEQILLLLSRCVLVALVALAIGKPVWGSLAGNGGGPRTVYLIVDDGLASQSVAAGASAQASAFERSRTRASDLLATLSPARGDRAAIIGVGAPARAIVMPPSADLSVALEALRQMSPTDARADWNGALAIVRDDQARSSGTPGGVVVALSEFRGGLDTSQKLTTLSAEAGPGASRSALALRASRPGTGELANIAIQSVEPARTLLIGALEGTEVEARVTLLRSGSAGDEAPVRVRLRVFGGNDEIGAGEGSVSIPAGAPTGAGVVRARLRTPPARGATMVLVAQLDPSAGGAIAGDDVFMLPLDARERLEVALVAPGPLGTGTTAADFTPGDWAALALSPTSAISARRRDEGEVRVALVEPRAVGGDAGSLAEFDAAWIVTPDALSASGWRAIASIAQRGGLVIVSPPPAVETHTWTDAMNEALGLDWTIARAATSFASPALVSPERAGWSGPDLLGAVAGELPELVRPVRVRKALGVQGAADAFETLLWLDAGGATSEPGATLTSAAPARLPLLVIARGGGGGTTQAGPVTAAGTGTSGASGTSGVSGVSGTVGTPDAPTAREGRAGLIALLTVAPDLSWSDLPAKPLMVPLVQELVRQGVGQSGTRGATPAGQSPSLPPGTRELVPLRMDTGDGTLATSSLAAGPNGASGTSEPGNERGTGGLAVSGGVPSEPVRRRGLFTARDASGLTLGTASFVADTQASATASAREDEVARWLASSGIESAWIDDADLASAGAAGASGAKAGEGTGASPLSTALLMAAGLVAIAELLMARFFSHAKREDIT